jgi:HTH-type transcriptional regulator / antitoxin HigA
VKPDLDAATNWGKMATVEIRPIKTEADYQAALREIESLFDSLPGTPDGERLEVWTTLVEVYEEKQYPIPMPDPIEAIRYHLESRGLSESDLEPLLGNRFCVADVMSRKRSLSLAMIRRLHAGFGISADLLIQPYSLVTSAIGSV